MDLAILSKPESDQQQAAPVFLRDAVKELMRLQGLHIELLTESEEDGWTIPITMLSNDDGEIDLKLCVLETTGELQSKDQQEYLCIETRPATNHFKKF